MVSQHGSSLSAPPAGPLMMAAAHHPLALQGEQQGRHTHTHAHTHTLTHTQTHTLSCTSAPVQNSTKIIWSAGGITGLSQQLIWDLGRFGPGFITDWLLMTLIN